jgi:hypothetical protein
MNDQGKTLFDPRIADWLEDDPNHVPDQALEIVLAAIPSIKQRHGSRLPWRFSPMSTSFKLALGAAAVVAVLLGGAFALGPRPPNGIGGPGPTPSPSISPSPSPSAPAAIDTSTWKSYTSERFGISGAYPPDFGATPASKFWVVPETDSTTSAEWDLLYLGSGDPTWSVASVALADGETPDAWLNAYRASQNDPSRPAACNPSPEALSPLTIDGHAGTLRLGCSEIEALVVVDGRAYSIGGWGGTLTTPGMPEGERERFEAFLSTIKLDPASALEPPPASPSPSPS